MYDFPEQPSLTTDTNNPYSSGDLLSFVRNNLILSAATSEISTPTMIFSGAVATDDATNTFLTSPQSLMLGDGYPRVEVYILNRVEELYTVSKWLLKCLASGDQSHSSRTFVNNCGGDGIVEIVFA